MSRLPRRRAQGWRDCGGCGDRPLHQRQPAVPGVLSRGNAPCRRKRRTAPPCLSFARCCCYTNTLPLDGGGQGGGDAAQLVGDSEMDAVEICQDLVVPKPQNAIALVLQELGSLGFAAR